MNYKNAVEQKKDFYISVKTKEKLINRILTFITIFSAIIALFVYGTVNSYYSAEVDGRSMSPTINSYYEDGSETKKNEIAYYTTYKTPQKGDIVIIDYEKAGLSAVDAIKRLIAVGGDTICYYNGEILINGKVLDEPYMDKSYNHLIQTRGKTYADEWQQNCYNTSKNSFNNFCKAMVESSLSEEYLTNTFKKNYTTDYANCIKYNDAIEGYVLTLPENYVYFLGDNRRSSNDCSDFGPIEKKYMLVKVDYVVPYGTSIFSAIWQSILKMF